MRRGLRIIQIVDFLNKIAVPVTLYGEKIEL